MKPNYNGNKKRREEAKKKWQEQKRDKRLQRKHEAAQPPVSESAPSPDAPFNSPPIEPQQG